MAGAGLGAHVQIKQTTGVKMTPEMQKAIALLQLSSIDLAQKIKDEVERNPLLEIDEDDLSSNEISLDENGFEGNDDDTNIFDNDSSYNDIESLGENTRIHEDGSLGSERYNESSSQDNPDNNADFDGSSVSSSTENHDDYYDDDARYIEEKQSKDLESQRIEDLEKQLKNDAQQSSDQSYEDYAEKYTAGTSSGRGLGDIDDDVYEGETSISLHDHLTEQLNLSPLAGNDKMIAEIIIDSVNDRGYLSESLEDITEVCKKHCEDIELEDVAAILKIVQHYDPAGVASRTPQECIIIQLNELEESRLRNISVKIVKEHWDLLTKRDFRSLKQKLSVSDEDVKTVFDIIRRLNPAPGLSFKPSESEYVVPDVLVVQNKDGTYKAVLNSNALPKVRLSEVYCSMAKNARTKGEKDFFKSNERDAKWFLTAINQRNDSLQKVADVIVETQAEFLEKGDAFMKPMILKDVAERIDRDESTVSRITSSKYILTPKGISMKLKDFFNSKVGTADGDSASSTAIKSFIRDFIKNENKVKPLSDETIAKMLDEKGYKVARRTVANYREELNILSSSKRKVLS